jgi:hypothetical protein
MRKVTRDYGLGQSGEPLGTPTWRKADVTMGCPNCKAQLCEVKVRVSHPHLKGGKGVSTYMGCPACLYASPALIAAHGKTHDEKGDEDGK